MPFKISGILELDDRDGIIHDVTYDMVVHLASITPDPLYLTKDDYFTKKQPTKSEELKNRIEVTTQPLLPVDTAEDIYKTGSLIALEALEEQTVTAYYSTQPALLTGTTINIEDNVGGEFQITAVTYYAWGAEFTIANIDPVLDGTGNVVIEGYPLRTTGSETVTAEDTSSIFSYGLQKYTLKKNHLIQTPQMAQDIAAVLLSSYKEQRKDVTLTWRGNPVIELGDTITVPEYQRDATLVLGNFKVTKNKLTYDGTLKETTDGRKI